MKEITLGYILMTPLALTILIAILNLFYQESNKNWKIALRRLGLHIFFASILVSAMIGFLIWIINF